MEKKSKERGNKEGQERKFPNLGRAVRERLRDPEGKKKQDMKFSGNTGF